MSKIKIGPAGLGGVKQAEKTLELYSEKGIKACEIAFTYGVYIKNKQDALRIGEKAKKLGIELSIHAPYWINLNSAEKEKIQSSKKRILNCCEVGELLKAKKVVFHAGYYGKNTKQETYENIKKQITELQKIIREKSYSIKLAPETMGKINVFGSISEISRLVDETGCSFCIDFAHILARYKEYRFDEVSKAFGKHKKWHIHFSGIEYGEKGEKRHKLTETGYWKKLLENLPKDKELTIINESPLPLDDAIKGINMLDVLRR